MRCILESTNKNYVYVIREYIYKHDAYFPLLGRDASIWAFRASTGLHYCEADPLKQEFPCPKEEDVLRLETPYCLLHNAWQDDKMIERKVNFYRDSGEIEGMLHPLEIGGELESLPEWMK